MTTIRLGVLHPTGTATDARSTGGVEWVPSARRVVGADVVLPDAFLVTLSATADVTVVVAPTTTAWVWRVLERISGGSGGYRYLAVPDSTEVVDYATLVEVDPATLDPVGPPPADVWALALAEAAEGLIGPTGVVAATAPVTYNSGTQTVGVTVGVTSGTVAAGDDSRITSAATVASVLSASHLHAVSARRQATANYASMAVSPTFTVGGTITGTKVTALATATGTATTATGSNQLTLSTLTAGRVGDVVAGTGLPLGTRIVSGQGTATVTLDQNATATGSAVAIAVVNPAAPWRYTGADVAAKGAGPAIVSGVDCTIAGSSPARALAGQQSWGLEFDFDGRYLLVDYNNQGTFTGRVWIDEQVSADFTVTTGSALLIDLGAKPTRPRRWWIEADTKLCMKSLTYLVTDTLLPPEPYAGPSLAIVGDSFGVGIGVLSASAGSTNGYAGQLAKMLGITNWRNYSVSQTGIVHGNNYPGRINDLIGYAPDLIFIQGSINDEVETQSAVQTGLTAYLQAIQAALPQSQIVVCSPVPVITPATTTIAVGQGMAAACVACGVPYLDFITNNALRLGYGSGREGATNGTGNADFYNGAIINLHPNFGGAWLRAHALAPLCAAVWNLGV